MLPSHILLSTFKVTQTDIFSVGKLLSPSCQSQVKLPLNITCFFSDNLLLNYLAPFSQFLFSIQNLNSSMSDINVTPLSFSSIRFKLKYDPYDRNWHVASFWYQKATSFYESNYLSFNIAMLHLYTKKYPWDIGCSLMRNSQYTSTKVKTFRYINVCYSDPKRSFV